MIRKILVQLDPSRPQRNARRLAVHLAQRLDAELLGLYVVDEDVLPGGESIYAVHDAFTALAEQSLSDLEHEVPEDVELDKFIGYGDTAKTVAHYVRKQGADLVVTGGHHMTAYKHVQFGSVVSDIINRVHTNVLMIRDFHPMPKEGQPILQTYGSDKASVKALYAAEPVVKALEAPLHLTAMGPRRRHDEYETVLMGAKAHEKKLGIELSVDVTHTAGWRPPWRRLMDASRKHQAGMISVHRDYMAPGFFGSTNPIEKLVIHTKVPLFVSWTD